MGNESLAPRIVEYNGVPWQLTKLAKAKGIGASTLKSRIARGWTVEMAADTPTEKTKVAKAVTVWRDKARKKQEQAPSRELKNYLLDRIKLGIEAMPDDEFQLLLHESLRKDFLGTIKELAPWMPKDDLSPKLATGIVNKSPVINIDKAYMPQNALDYEPL